MCPCSNLTCEFFTRQGRTPNGNLPCRRSQPPLQIHQLRINLQRLPGCHAASLITLPVLAWQTGLHGDGVLVRYDLPAPSFDDLIDKEESLDDGERLDNEELEFLL